MTPALIKIKRQRGIWMVAILTALEVLVGGSLIYMGGDVFWIGLLTIPVYIFFIAYITKLVLDPLSHDGYTPLGNGMSPYMVNNMYFNNQAMRRDLDLIASEQIRAALEHKL